MEVKKTLIFSCHKRREHTQRQATQHGCLPSFLGDGDKGIEIVYDEEKICCTGPSRAATRQKINLLYWHDKPNEPT
jgi:hypothetical protein